MYLYNPALVSAKELPIWYKAVYADTTLWRYRDAKSFCKHLMKHENIDIFGFSTEELKGIKAVSEGRIWPIPEKVYSNLDWSRDGYLLAVAGQEIDSTVYYKMRGVLLPYPLPKCERTEEYASGFLSSEPECGAPYGYKELYSAFGIKDGRCYFIGLLPR